MYPPCMVVGDSVWCAQASQLQQSTVTSVLSEPQRALLSTITSGRQIIKHTEETLTRVSRTLPSYLLHLYTNLSLSILFLK